MVLPKDTGLWNYLQKKYNRMIYQTPDWLSYCQSKVIRSFWLNNKVM